MVMNASLYQKRFDGAVSRFGKVAVLYGGISAERAVSLDSGEAVIAGLKSCGADVLAVDLNEDAVTQLSNIQCDRAFIVLHGVGGEDGRVQALLQWMGIPFTGSDVAASALSLNKIRTKLVWKGANLPTPEFEILRTNSNFSEILSALGGECFVKPASEGSSLGMRCVDTVESLGEAYMYAAGFDAQVLAERKINGREFSVSILNGMALPAIELKVKNAFYDYDAKYVSDQTEYTCPALISDEENEHLKALAIEAFDVLGCKGWGRIDFMRDENGKYYLLEANTVPGMTSHSLVPMAAKAAGLSFSELLQEVLVSTLEEKV